ncbi:phage tail protein [Erwinia persicina]|nr:phage tail protein [Erwinia persicina]
MALKFKSVVTTAGQARIAAAMQGGTQVDIKTMVVGDGSGQPTTPLPGQTGLVHEVYRQAVNSVKVESSHKNWLVIETIIPASAGGFWMRELGLLAGDGTLLAVSNMAETYKPALEEGSGRTQTLRMVLAVSSSEAIALTLDDSLIFATEEYVNLRIASHEQSRNHPDATLAAKGMVMLSSAINSGSETQAATPKAVKAAYDLANRTQPDATLAAKGVVMLSSATNSSSETQAATPKAVKAAYDLANRNVLNEIYPVGIVTWFAQNKNPNTLFPGTTWKYIGENRTIRLAKADGSDAFTTGGADAVSLSVANLPAHNHTFSGTTSSFDYGTKPTSTFDYGSKSTNSTGEHTHTISGRNKEGNKTQLSFISTTDASYITQTTTAAGAHIHTVAIGAHTHTVGIGAHTHTVSGTTASTGSGAALAITNSFIKLMGWYRSA